MSRNRRIQRKVISFKGLCFCFLTANGFCYFSCFETILFSRNFVVFPVSWHFTHSRDLVVSPVSRHFPGAKSENIERSWKAKCGLGSLGNALPPLTPALASKWKIPYKPKKGNLKEPNKLQKVNLDKNAPILHLLGHFAWHNLISAKELYHLRMSFSIEFWMWGGRDFGFELILSSSF